MLQGVWQRAEKNIDHAGKHEGAGPGPCRPPRWSPWRDHDEHAPSGTEVVGRPTVVCAIKGVHTLAWFSIESCMLYLLYAGFTRRSDRKAGIAAVVVGGETLIFAGNGFRCPLTEVAQRYGAEQGSVTDIYLPNWFAHNLPAIHAPLLVLAIFLHGRNLRQGRRPVSRQNRRRSFHATS